MRRAQAICRHPHQGHAVSAKTQYGIVTLLAQVLAKVRLRGAAINADEQQTVITAKALNLILAKVAAEQEGILTAA
ncbi:hypothetical protein D3C77_667710 [compost metagenome]